METCPRCAEKLSREDSRRMTSTWQVDRNGVVVSCHLQVTEMSSAFCPGCFFQEAISFDQIESRGTAIGSALAVGTNRMRESKSKSKVLILLSDGENTAGNI